MGRCGCRSRENAHTPVTLISHDRRQCFSLEDMPVERFADEVDLAQRHIDYATECAVANILHRAREGRGRRQCVDCGEVIAEARRQHVPNATRCVACQERHERVFRSA